MKIHFSKQEYRLLLDFVAIAEWVMNSHRDEEDPRSQPYDVFEQKILSYAKDFGFENLVTYDRKDEKYYPTLEYEESEPARSFVDEFEDEVFWDTLCNRLAQRDLIRKKGIEQTMEMNPIERLTEEDEIADSYIEEFMENGLDNLVLSKK